MDSSSMKDTGSKNAIQEWPKFVPIAKEAGSFHEE